MGVRAVISKSMLLLNQFFFIASPRLLTIPVRPATDSTSHYFIWYFYKSQLYTIYLLLHRTVRCCSDSRNYLERKIHVINTFSVHQRTYAIIYRIFFSHWIFSRLDNIYFNLHVCGRLRPRFVCVLKISITIAHKFRSLSSRIMTIRVALDSV